MFSLTVNLLTRHYIVIIQLKGIIRSLGTRMYLSPKYQAASLKLKKRILGPGFYHRHRNDLCEGIRSVFVDISFVWLLNVSPSLLRYTVPRASLSFFSCCRCDLLYQIIIFHFVFNIKLVHLSCTRDASDDLGSNTWVDHGNARQNHRSTTNKQ